MALLPPDLEELFAFHSDTNNHEALLQAFMPLFCDHLKADRIFLQPRNPLTRVCKILRWRRNESIPWYGHLLPFHYYIREISYVLLLTRRATTRPAIPGDTKENEWFVEEHWEDEDPLWSAALQLKPSIYITDLSSAAQARTLNLDFEQDYMFHTAFIHGHAHWPPLQTDETALAKRRNFYGSVQPAVFNGPRIWSTEERELVEKCLARIAPVMKAYAESAPSLESFDGK